MTKPRIRLGMVGGGQDAFIGAVHRIAARIDDQFELVAGALSSTPERALASGLALGLEQARIYSDFEVMAQQESEREDGIEAVAIVTPNHLHFPVARAFLQAGIHVICDKPMTATLQEAEALLQLSQQHKALFVLTHTYTGYPMVRQAREMVVSGQLGTLRVAQVNYTQDWLTEPLEQSGNKQASWRTDPARSGAGGCIGDIGTHAYQLLSYISGLKTASLCAEMSSFVAGRTLDDNVQILLRMRGGARATLWASQVAAGCENRLDIRLYGDKGGLEWSQEHPNQLWFTPYGGPAQLLTRGGAGATAMSRAECRVPAGHPEGYLEAFASLYRDTATAIRHYQQTGEVALSALLPGIEDGVEGMRFIDCAVRSGRDGAVWVDLA
ncbi:Gfo/Idh/MocA family oxidoreductase [Pokkaliibacter sp. MBI-7]|uniref:Gfo/Idh/MocA family protein n=1 Tax=Pokkaliibacter sp. MBI-7 TaxID=3040600 RepID=UPI00244CA0E8|nr:Gfo/Idh/MocA family oxidoreductase [Pokkaliibacter sp. MBI-7]MDH2436258.1 Gfo/Idh/MocA family oxidoreductase [Pokkaliibacter sp. MBI-7]